MFLEKCEETGLALIGLEGFRLEEGATRPLLDLIADCTPSNATEWTEYCRTANACSRMFLGQVEDRAGLHFAVVVIGKPDWKP